jgi:uncharacterized membrane protein
MHGMQRICMTSFSRVIEVVGLSLDGAGVFVIAGGALISSVSYIRSLGHGAGGPVGAGDAAYPRFRRNVGRAILLGLELLVAGDIIRTVVVDPTLQNVFVLGLIVLIRTFLSMSIQVELEGRWPWQRDHPGPAPGRGVGLKSDGSPQASG